MKVNWTAGAMWAFGLFLVTVYYSAGVWIAADMLTPFHAAAEVYSFAPLIVIVLGCLTAIVVLIVQAFVCTVFGVGASSSPRDALGLGSP